MSNKNIIIRTDADALAYLGDDPRNDEGLVEVRDCGRCAGTGYWCRGHVVHNGVCFSCRGTGGLKRLTLVEYAQRQRRSEGRRRRAQAKREAKRAAHEAQVKKEAEAKAERDREIQRQREEEREQSQFLGSVGERLTVTAQVLCKRSRMGQWGESTWFLMKSTEGHILTWNASGGFTVEQRDVVRLKATVKAHDTYNGTRQTVLTRGRFEQVLGDD